MSMRARLSLAIGAVIVVTLMLFGFVVVRDTRMVLVDQLDAQIRDFSKRTLMKDDGKKYGTSDMAYQPSPEAGTPASNSTTAQGGQNPPKPNTGDGNTTSPNDPGENHPLSQDFSRYVYDKDGTLIVSQEAEYWSDSDPDLPTIPSDEFSKLVGRIVTVPSTNGKADCRVYVVPIGNGGFNVSSASLEKVNDTIGSLTRFLLLGGGIAVALALIASWFIIRRELRPVDHMVVTATAIATGDLSQRVTDPDPRTELGRLGGALNEMLSQIEQAMQVRTESEDRLRRFVADAAHELRTPLTSLRGYAELYRQGALPTKEGVDRAMGRIESEGSRMARLVEDLLLLARLDQHRALEHRPVNISTLVQDAVTDFHVVAPERPVTSHLEPGLVVMGDSLRLRQVLDNLLVNTRAHTPIGTTVHVELRRRGDRIEVVVEDDGPGISAEDQKHVFERFWRADPARSRSSGGSGLGLAITASIVEAQTGTIEVVSESGKGARFTISLPIPTASDLAPVPDEEAAQSDHSDHSGQV